MPLQPTRNGSLQWVRFFVPPASGYRASNSGGLNDVGSRGYAWSSSPSSASSVYGSYLGFDSSNVNPEYNFQAVRAVSPVRCVQE